MGSHNLIEERFTLHQMSGSLRIRSLKSLCHMGNCNLIVWSYTAPRNSREAYWGKKSFCFIDFVSSANLRNFMIHDYINNTRNDFIFIFLEPCCDRFQIYPVWCIWVVCGQKMVYVRPKKMILNADRGRLRAVVTYFTSTCPLF